MRPDELKEALARRYTPEEAPRWARSFLLLRRGCAFCERPAYGTAGAVGAGPPTHALCYNHYFGHA